MAVSSAMLLVAVPRNSLRSIRRPPSMITTPSPAGPGVPRARPVRVDDDGPFRDGRRAGLLRAGALRCARPAGAGAAAPPSALLAGARLHDRFRRPTGVVGQHLRVDNGQVLGAGLVSAAVVRLVADLDATALLRDKGAGGVGASIDRLTSKRCADPGHGRTLAWIEGRRYGRP